MDGFEVTVGALRDAGVAGGSAVGDVRGARSDGACDTMRAARSCSVARKTL